MMMDFFVCCVQHKVSVYVCVVMADQRCVCIDCVFSNGVREMVGFLVHVRVD